MASIDSQCNERMQRRKTISVHPGLLTCAGCHKGIFTRYLIGALKKYWHEDCLVCDTCKRPVIKHGEKFYFHAGKKFCHRDYARAYGKSGVCKMCEETIPATDYALKFKNLCYHVECFNCCTCRNSFCVGDKFVMINEKEILCIEDYQKRTAEKKCVVDVKEEKTC